MKWTDKFFLIVWTLVIAGVAQLFSSLFGLCTFVSVLLSVISIFSLCVIAFVLWAIILRYKATRGKDLGDME